MGPFALPQIADPTSKMTMEKIMVHLYEEEKGQLDKVEVKEQEKKAHLAGKMRIA
jgi:hypothetical protein